MLDRSGFSEGDFRALAVETVRSVLPSRAGDPWFERELCQGRTGDRGYAPGPELCHWLLWKLGCRDSRILSRDVPELNIRYTERGVDRLVLGAQRLTAWRPFVLENVPRPGDMLHLGSISRGEPEHVCVFLAADGASWTTADVVPCDRRGHWQAEVVVRRLEGFRMAGRTSAKQLNGWADLWAAFNY